MCESLIVEVVQPRCLISAVIVVEAIKHWPRDTILMTPFIPE